MPKLAISIAFLAGISLLPMQGYADGATRVIHYNFEPLLDRINVRCEWIRGDLEENRKALAAKNIIDMDSGEEIHVEREDMLGEHKIRTIITGKPPVGHGVGGGNSTAHITMLVDGYKKIDTPLCYLASFNDLDVRNITLNGDGVLDFDASMRLHINKTSLETAIEIPNEYVFFAGYNDDTIKKVIDTDLLSRLEEKLIKNVEAAQ